MLDKDKRIINKKLIIDIKKIGYCEICGSSFLLQAHHIKSKGSGGHDIESNLICLCYLCHRQVHDGNISREKLKNIVSRRNLLC